jgi:GNAT superfamily N-acetyltransferase
VTSEVPEAPVISQPARPGWRVTSGRPAPGTVRRLLAMQPEWFSIDAAAREHARASRVLPAYLAWPPSRSLAPETWPSGFLLVRRHFPGAAEIHLAAVHPARQRAGAGRAMVAAMEADLAADGVRYVQVKTIGPAYPEWHYDLIRQFWLAVGFRPLEETEGVWRGNPCMIMVKSLTRPGTVQ